MPDAKARIPLKAKSRRNLLLIEYFKETSTCRFTLYRTFAASRAWEERVDSIFVRHLDKLADMTDYVTRQRESFSDPFREAGPYQINSSILYTVGLSWATTAMYIAFTSFTKRSASCWISLTTEEFPEIWAYSAESSNDYGPVDYDRLTLFAKQLRKMVRIMEENVPDDDPLDLIVPIESP